MSLVSEMVSTSAEKGQKQEKVTNLTRKKLQCSLENVVSLTTNHGDGLDQAPEGHLAGTAADY